MPKKILALPGRQKRAIESSTLVALIRSQESLYSSDSDSDSSDVKRSRQFGNRSSFSSSFDEDYDIGDDTATDSDDSDIGENSSAHRRPVVGKAKAARHSEEVEPQTPKLPEAGIHKLSLPALKSITHQQNITGTNIGQSIIDFYERGGRRGLSSDDDDADDGSGNSASDHARPIKFSELKQTNLVKDLETSNRVKVSVWEGKSRGYKPKFASGIAPYFDCSDSVIPRLHYLTVAYFTLKNDDDSDRHEAYALTTGEAWKLVSPFSEPDYPRNVAKAILSPSLREAKTRALGGDVYSSQRIFSEFHKVLLGDHMNNVIQLFKAPIQSKEVLNSPGYKRRTPVSKNKASTPKGHTVEVSLLQVKFMRQLTFPNFLNLIPVVSNEIYRMKEPSSDFAFLDLVRPVPIYNVLKLDYKIAELVFSALTENESINFDILASNFRAFQKATAFSLSYPANRGKRFATWERESDWIKAHQILDHLRPAIDTLGKDKASFAANFSDVILRYKVGSSWHSDHLVRCFQGEVSADDQKFFRIDGTWYQVSHEFLEMLHKDFQILLKESLVTADDANHHLYMPKKWKHYPVLKKEEKEGTASSTSFSTSEKTKGTPDKYRFTRKDLRNKLGLKSDASGREAGDGIIDALIEEKIVKEAPISQRKYEVHSSADLNNFQPKGAVLVPHKDRLLDFLKSHERDLKKDPLLKVNRDEQLYNRKYLTEKKCIVGDCTTPDGLELFDVLRFSNRKDAELRLFHNKKGFGHHVRDVCSQIINAAETIVNARNNFKKNNETPIDRLHKALVSSDLTKKSQQDFRDLFATPELKKLEFVFGFMEDAKKDRSLEIERTRLLSEKTGFISNIARMELLRARTRLSELGVTLKIVTIPHDDTGGTIDEAHQILSHTQSLDGCGLVDDTSATSQPMDVGGVFYNDGGNTCWMTPFLLLMRHSGRIKELITQIRSNSLTDDHQKNLLISIQKFTAGHYLNADEMKALRQLLLKNGCLLLTVEQQKKWDNNELSDSEKSSLLQQQYDPQEVLSKVFDKLGNHNGKILDFSQTFTAKKIPGEPYIPKNGPLSEASDLNSPSFGTLSGDTLEVAQSDPNSDPLLICAQNTQDLETDIRDQFCTNEPFEESQQSIKPYEYLDPDSQDVMTGKFKLHQKRNERKLKGKFLWIDLGEFESDLPEIIRLDVEGVGVNLPFHLSTIVEHRGIDIGTNTSPYAATAGGHYYSYHKVDEQWQRFEYGRSKAPFDTIDSLRTEITDRRKTLQFRYKLLYEVPMNSDQA